MGNAQNQRHDLRKMEDTDLTCESVSASEPDQTDHVHVTLADCVTNSLDKPDAQTL